MKYTYDEPFADSFICNGDVNFHDYYYISSSRQSLDSLFYCINWTGIFQNPRNFFCRKKIHYQIQRNFLSFFLETALCSSETKFTSFVQNS